MFCDSKNELYLSFLHPILKHVQEVTKLFESNTVDKTKLLEDLSSLIKSVANMIVLLTCRIDQFDPDASIENFVNLKPNLGYRFERNIAEMIIKKIVTATEENNIRKRTQFLLCLYKELKHRWPENINILQNIKCFSVQNILQHFKEPILPVLEAVHLNEEKIASIEIQFNSIHLVEWTNISNTEEFWLEVLEYKDATGGNPFRDVANFAINLLTLTNSNTEVERLFNSMGVIKSKLRYKMHLPMLRSTPSIKYGLKRYGKCYKNFNIPKHIINKIGALNVYRSRDLSTAAENNQISEIQEIISQC
ncbi:Hypothetical predicted protein [Octopus vulgaris]|uniref:HAT C-terminal dimerisation domain-containing protein n=1 Tax=Octopus vulgaris TaxID=6645 RepID=A0AA36BJI3_OCTVU|nr:Hypothetical predicted protein [Octopus vulgaris]